jgi:hypothetical protein
METYLRACPQYLRAYLQYLRAYLQYLRAYLQYLRAYLRYLRAYLQYLRAYLQCLRVRESVSTAETLIRSLFMNALVSSQMAIAKFPNWPTLWSAGHPTAALN